LPVRHRAWFHCPTFLGKLTNFRSQCNHAQSVRSDKTKQTRGEHERMARGGHGLPKESPGPAMPYPSAPCGWPDLRDLLPFWTSHAERLWRRIEGAAKPDLGFRGQTYWLIDCLGKGFKSGGLPRPSSPLDFNIQRAESKRAKSLESR
jgi:hypothetical protein